MKQNIYIFSNSIVKRKQNTLYFERIIEEEKETDFDTDEEYLFGNDIILPSGEKKFMPIENIESLTAVGSIRFNSRLLNFLSYNRIPIHVISVNGNWSGTFYPAGKSFSGNTLLAQANSFMDEYKRLSIAIKIVETTAQNTLIVLKYYRNRGSNLDETIGIIEELKDEIPHAEDVEELFGLEGYIKHTYYSAWKEIFVYPVPFTSRKKKPSPDFINSMISFGNALLYTVVTNQIYSAKLYPEIGYMHTPGENKFSLAYDIADIYKPLIVDRTIFKLVNKNILSEKDFFNKRGMCLMKKETKKTFVQFFEERLFAKHTHENFSKKVTLRKIIRSDLTNLKNFVSDNGELKFYEARW